MPSRHLTETQGRDTHHGHDREPRRCHVALQHSIAMCCPDVTSKLCHASVSPAFDIPLEQYLAADIIAMIACHSCTCGDHNAAAGSHSFVLNADAKLTVSHTCTLIRDSCEVHTLYSDPERLREGTNRCSAVLPRHVSLRAGQRRAEGQSRVAWKHFYADSGQSIGRPEMSPLCQP